LLWLKCRALQNRTGRWPLQPVIEGSPWAEHCNGKPITATGLARLLKPYGIGPEAIRIVGQTPKWYRLNAFIDKFRRYLPPLGDSNRNTETNAENKGFHGDSQPQQPDNVLRFENSQNINNDGLCFGVAVETPPAASLRGRQV